MRIGIGQALRPPRQVTPPAPTDALQLGGQTVVIGGEEVVMK